MFLQPGGPFMREAPVIPAEQRGAGAAVVRILGIDPGTRLIGYGVIDYDPGDPLRPRLVDAGVIRLDGTTPLHERLLVLDRELDVLITDTRPAAVAVEAVYAHRDFPRTSITMAHARGVMLLACARNGLVPHELSPNRVKEALTGHGHAKKVQMQRAVQVLWDLPEPPEPPDVADALAVAVCLGRSGITNV